MPKSDGNVRVNYAVSKSRDEQLDRLQAAFCRRTRTDVLDLATDILTWSMRELGAGRIIGSFDTDNGVFRELMLPTGVPERVAEFESPKTSPRRKTTNVPAKGAHTSKRVSAATV